MDGSPTEGPQGGRLVLAATGVFLAPLVLAVVGAIVAGRGATEQSLGAGAGLALGALVSVVVGRVLRRTGREIP